MAAKELYDYLSTIAADVNQTLSLVAQGEITEEGGFTQAVHSGDDGSEERVNLGGTAPIWYVNFNLNTLTASDAGTVVDLYFDTAKAYGMINSFKWASDDGHTYVVRFADPLPRSRHHGVLHGVKKIRLRILGRISD